MEGERLEEMKEIEWDNFLNKLKNKLENDVVNTREYDNKYLNGVSKIRKFLRVILENREKPFEKHQFDCLMDGMPIFYEWSFGNAYMVKTHKKIISTCKFKHEKNVMLVIIKRQFGKTEFLVRIACASVISFNSPDIQNKPNEWIIVSHKGRHAKEILDRCYDYLLENKQYWADDFEIKKLQKSITLTNKFNKYDKRILATHEGNIDGLAGKKFFGDEFFKWNDDVANVQFPPQLQVKGTNAILATTLRGRVHWSIGWLKTDNPLIHVINMSEMCWSCSKLPMEMAMKCVHTPKLQAHFINKERRMAIAMLMPKTLALREMCNMMPNTKGILWTEEYVRANISRRFSDSTKPYVYYMFVDPSMTSEDGSHSACTIITKEKNNILICSLNSVITSSNTDIVNFIIEEAKHFFNMFTGNQGYMYLFVESNTVNHSHEVKKKLKKNPMLNKKVKYVRGIKYDRKKKQYKRYGVTKKAGDEERFCNILGKAMSKERIFIHPKCITRNMFQSMNEMIEMLVMQCSRVKKISKNNKIRVVSKFGVGNEQVNNDLYISLVSAIHYTKRINDTNDILSINVEDRFIK